MRMSQKSKDLALDLGEEMERFLRQYCEEELYALWQKYPNEKRDLWVDYSDLVAWNPEMADMVVGQLEGYTRTDFTDALLDVLVELDPPIDVRLDPDRVSIRVYNLNDAHRISVGEYWSDQLGDYIAVTGQISKATPVRPKYKTRGFDCVRCGVTTIVPQVGDQGQEPGSCDGCDRNGPFTTNDEKSEATDYQRLRLEQLPEEVRGDTSDQIDIVIEGRLVRWLAERDVKSGSRVTVTGVLGTEDEDGAIASNWVLEAHAVEVEEDDLNADEISEEERAEIEAYAKGEYGDPFTLLGDSLAPSLKGHELVEEVEYDGQQWTKWRWIKTLGGLSHLFQGWRKPNGDGTFQRGTSHMLLMGDPSTGKSTFMQAIERHSPRSATTSGKGASAAGMTAAAVKDDFGNAQWSLEAGVLVKAHGGVATVDEIDKIHPDAVESMHTALEQQTINVSKAGIHATLPCQTSLLAAGNPKNSRFTEYDKEIEQIDLVGSLLDRFDLVFVLKDKPDEQRDRDLAEHVIRSRTDAGKAERGDLDEDERETSGAIPSELLIKWVKIARDVNPVIEDDEVFEEIRDFYVKIRQSNDSDGPVPASVRTLDGLLRLSEAAARFRLSDTIEMCDAQIAIAGVKASLEDIGYDPETGELDIDAASGNTSHSQRDRVERLKGIVGELSSAKTAADRDNVLETAEQAGIERGKAEKEIEKLKQKGELYSPATNKLRTT